MYYFRLINCVSNLFIIVFLPSVSAIKKLNFGENGALYSMKEHKTQWGIVLVICDLKLFPTVIDNLIHNES
jgi:hypothetical protein